MREPIHTDDAPNAVGAYSQAVATSDRVYTAGQIPATPDGTVLDDAPIDEQAAQAIDNLAAVLAAAGTGLDALLDVTIYLADIEDFEAVDAVYADRIGDRPPARSAVGVEDLPKGVGIEIEGVAQR
ncbi:Rid family detoxifying hydrolase [Halococcoides cellulosivorans]|uniref:Reactive intermediate/imine deaminase n=1 Tax=Halococcoides cellulosivorans TaxID=1679096 RepID=A0A2R4WY40_9EURY|nr:Rid family detoxifying hydrolase [Halococcoides cellulosivorans]AWB26454.1 reactive intermediate/imine deaminase [Halococcoides cellulosivorans]